MVEGPSMSGSTRVVSYIDASRRPFGEGWPAPQTPSRRFLSGECPLPHIVTLMVRRDACDRIGNFDEEIVICEDLDLTLRLAQVGELLAIPAPLVHYRRHHMNVSQAGSLADRRARIPMLAKQVRSAAAREDVSAVLLLRENLHRARVAAASEAVNGAVAALRQRDVKRLLGEIRWAAATPVSTLRAGARKLASPRWGGAR